jgi:hypothetical protein
VALLQVGLEAVGEDSRLLGIARNIGDRLEVCRGRVLRIELIELVRRLPLLDRAVRGGERLLPGEGEAHVGEHDDPRRDQHDRADTQKAPHRGDSRSVA